MTEDDRMQLKLVGFLLEYPDAPWAAALGDLDGAVDAVADGRRRELLRRFLAYAGNTPPIKLQETYTAAFDLQPAMTLNLSYHAYGDNEKRAAAMARLQHLYELAGWARTGGELPDHLPLLLEFLTLHPQPATLIPVWQCLQATARLAEALDDMAPAYAALLRPLAQVAAGMVAKNDQASAPA